MGNEIISLDGIKRQLGLLVEQAYHKGAKAERQESADAFDKGYSKGMTDSKATINDAYDRGLNDAWMTAKAFCSDFNYYEAEACFGRDACNDNYVFFSAKPEVRIDQLRAYEEQKKAEETQIKLGDEVEAFDTNEWVKFIAVGDIGDGTISGFDLNGGSYEYPKTICRKTGKKWKVIQDG